MTNEGRINVRCVQKPIPLRHRWAADAGVDLICENDSSLREAVARGEVTRDARYLEAVARLVHRSE